MHLQQAGAPRDAACGRAPWASRDDSSAPHETARCGGGRKSFAERPAAPTQLTLTLPTSTHSLCSTQQLRQAKTRFAPWRSAHPLALPANSKFQPAEWVWRVSSQGRSSCASSRCASSGVLDGCKTRPSARRQPCTAPMPPHAGPLLLLAAAATRSGPAGGYRRRRSRRPPLSSSGRLVHTPCCRAPLLTCSTATAQPADRQTPSSLCAPSRCCCADHHEHRRVCHRRRLRRLQPHPVCGAFVWGHAASHEREGGELRGCSR